MDTPDPNASQTTHQRLSHLRALLHKEPIPPEPTGWDVISHASRPIRRTDRAVHPSEARAAQIMHTLDTWPDAEDGLKTAAQYIAEHFDRWPAALCRPPEPWLEQLRSDPWDPRWTTLRTLPVESYRWKTSQVQRLLQHPDSHMTRLEIICDLRSKQGLSWCRSLAKNLPESGIDALDMRFKHTPGDHNRGDSVANTDEPYNNGAFHLVSALPGLRTLALRQCHIHGRALTQALFQSPSLTQLTALDLSYNALETVGAQELIASGIVEHLDDLNLTCSGLGHASIRAFIHTIALEHLSGLSLRGNGFGRPGAEELGQARHLNNLRKLDLSATQPARRKPWLHLIADARWLPDLTHLQLDNNGIYDPDLIALMARPRALTHLCAPRNLLTDGIVSPLIESLCAGTLTHLDLSHNTLTAVAAGQLVRAARLSNLQHLDLSHNPIDDTFAQTLSQRYGRPTALRTLRIVSARPAPEIARAIARSEMFPNLQTLHLNGAALKTSDIIDIIEAPTLPNLQALHITSGAFTKRDRKKMAQALGRRATVHLTLPTGTVRRK